MPTYYRLKPNTLLRGWDKLPFAVVHARTKRVDFVPKDVMHTLRRCDDTWDFDSIFCTDEDRTNAAAMLERGSKERCGAGDGIMPAQRYRRYPNRFMQSIYWSITGRCNYRCRHCFMSAPEARYGELSHEAVMDIARAFATKPAIMVLDEATSALDNITQKKVLDAVYAEKCTVLMVAHRLSTVMSCDRILVMENGQIVEEGTYDELLEADGLFSRLVRKQVL